MAHQIANNREFAASLLPAWHGLGVVTPNVMNSEQAINFHKVNILYFVYCGNEQHYYFGCCKKNQEMGIEKSWLLSKNPNGYVRRSFS